MMRDHHPLQRVSRWASVDDALGPRRALVDFSRVDFCRGWELWSLGMADLVRLRVVRDHHPLQQLPRKCRTF